MTAVIVRVVELSCRYAAATVGLVLLLALAGGYYTADNISIDTDVNKLIAQDLPWRQQEAEMDQAFPQNQDLLVVVIDGKTPDIAGDAAAALA
jgi:uncharacterized protein